MTITSSYYHGCLLVIPHYKRSKAWGSLIFLKNRFGCLQGRYDEAESLLQQALSMTKHLLGVEHPAIRFG